ncbi:MAG: fumarylacetoacetate hydrolase family protein [Flavobacteriales bacterium AspAUS03]
MPATSTPQYFGEITLGIDFTTRDLQKKLKKNDIPWEKYKSFDQSAAIGTWIPKNTINLYRFNFSLRKKIGKPSKTAIPKI